MTTTSPSEEATYFKISFHPPKVVIINTYVNDHPKVSKFVKLKFGFSFNLAQTNPESHSSQI